MNDPISKYHTVIILIRRFIHSGGMVLFYYFPIIQVLSVMMPNLILLLICLFKNPHMNTRMKFIETFTEIGFFCIHSIIFIFSMDNAS